jgi:hypothetical protein
VAREFLPEQGVVVVQCGDRGGGGVWVLAEGHGVQEIGHAPQLVGDLGQSLARVVAFA